MILQVDGGNRAAFMSACELNPIMGAQARTDYLVRGNDANTGFWIAGENGRPTAALGLVDGRMLIAAAGRPGGREPDAEELTAFLHANGAGSGGIHQVTAPVHIIQRLGLSGHQITAPAMRYPGRMFRGNFSRVVTKFPLSDLYDTIVAGFPGYSDIRERWYVCTSHLFRHNLGFAAAIYEDGCMAATGGVYSMSANVGVIACVATLPLYRGRGFARLLVRYLCNRLLAMGKQPALQCAEESLAHYYGSIGFQVCGRWGRILTG